MQGLVLCKIAEPSRISAWNLLRDGRLALGSIQGFLGRHPQLFGALFGLLQLGEFAVPPFQLVDAAVLVKSRISQLGRELLAQIGRASCRERV